MKTSKTPFPCLINCTHNCNDLSCSELILLLQDVLRDASLLHWMQQVIHTPDTFSYSSHCSAFISFLFQRNNFYRSYLAFCLLPFVCSRFPRREEEMNHIHTLFKMWYPEEQTLSAKPSTVVNYFTENVHSLVLKWVLQSIAHKVLFYDSS